MKRILLIALAAAALLWGVNAWSLSRQREAMEKVLAARLSARKFCNVIVKDRTRMEIQQYRQALDQIDASRCPKVFAVAWQDYVHAWDLICQCDKPERIVFATDSSVEAESEAAERQADAIRRFNEAITAEAFHKCQRIAAVYGVVATNK